MIVVGVDQGATGALAAIEGSRGERPRLLEVIDVPMIGEKSLRRVHSSPVLAFLQRHKPDRGMVERAQAMPILRHKGKTGPDGEPVQQQAQGVSSAFNYGRTCGGLVFALDGMGVGWEYCESTQWKRTNGIATGVAQKVAKEQARHRASTLFGTAPFKRVMDHNRAEAALIAWHGLQVFLSNPALTAVSSHKDHQT